MAGPKLDLPLISAAIAGKEGGKPSKTALMASGAWAV